jgi:hypothetical protein
LIEGVWIWYICRRGDWGYNSVFRSSKKDIYCRKGLEMNKAKLLGIAIIMVLALFLNADKALSTSFLLTANADGNGMGSVSLDIGGISYSYPLASTGSAMLDSGTTVTLTATPNAGSTVAWSGACSSTGGTPPSATCTISSMTSAKTVTADYRLASCGFQPVKNDVTSLYYWTIQAAYNAAISPQSVQIQAGDFAEDLLLANTEQVKLSGGYSCSYSLDSGITKVHGVMTIKGGAVTVENVEIDSCNAPTTASFVGTQSPGDYWSWSETTTANGSISFSASNITLSHNYSGSGTRLTGNSAGFSKLVITGTNDTGVTAGSSAYALEVPDTVHILAVAPFVIGTYSGVQESIRAPVFAAAQGSCPSTTTNANWITMPSASWCPVVGAANPLGNECLSAGDAYGTAVISVSGGTYGISVTRHKLDGSAGGTFSLSSCSCSAGVIQCSDGGNPVRISFTPSGVFFVDTPTDAMVGIVQPDSAIDLPDFLQNGRTFKAVWYTSLDSDGIFNNEPDCTAHGGTWVNINGGICGTHTTQPAAATTDGSRFTGHPYSDIDTGTVSAQGGSINLGTGATQPFHGLIKGTFTSVACTQGGQEPPPEDIVMAVRQVNGNYVGLILTHSPCTTFDVGFNVLAVEQ